jgi:hypothetical protein
MKRDLKSRLRAFRIAGLSLLLGAGSAGALTLPDLLPELTEEAYRFHHTNLFVWSGQNRGFTATTDAAVPRVPVEQHDRALDYMTNAFALAGFEVSLDPFTFERGYGQTYLYSNCNNVVAWKPGYAGTNADIYIVGAHYDSVDSGQFSDNGPGADDNASGTAGILAVARLLAAHTFRDHLYFIAFDAEEKGLKGSWHYVDHSTTTDPAQTNLLLRSRIKGMISLDMIAYNPPAATNQAHIMGGGGTNQPVRKTLHASFVRHTDLQVVDARASSASDHHPFWQRGIDSCLLIEPLNSSGYPLNPYYHKLTDAVDTAGYIDYPYAVKMSRAVAAWLVESAGWVPPATLRTGPEGGAAGSFVVSWDAPTGMVQILEYTDRLPSTNWQVWGVFTNLNAADYQTVTDSVGTVERRFYRVLTQPE